MHAKTPDCFKDKDLKTSKNWQKLCKIQILDPDGWNRKNFDYSWKEELINRNEFEKRMFHSTIKGDLLQKNIWIDQE